MLHRITQRQAIASLDSRSSKSMHRDGQLVLEPECTLECTLRSTNLVLHQSKITRLRQARQAREAESRGHALATRAQN